MNLIKISNEYSIIVEEYVKLFAGQEIKSKIELKRMILFPKITKDTATLRNLEKIIELFIEYVKVGSGHTIRITAVKPPQAVNEIVQSYLNAKKTTDSRQSYSCNRKHLLDSLIPPRENKPQYYTTSKIIRNSTVFQDFYYEYCGINYDQYHSSKEEVQELDDFIKDYEIPNKNCLVNTMEIMNEILYNTVFDKENIYNWAKKRPVTIEKVLFQSGSELDEETSEFLFSSYFQPLIDKRVSAKLQTRFANRNYMIENKIPYHKHKFFYFTFKFTKTDSFAVKINHEELKHHKKEISGKVIEKLTSNIKALHGGSYYARNETHFNEIMNRIKI